MTTEATEACRAIAKANRDAVCISTARASSARRSTCASTASAACRSWTTPGADFEILQTFKGRFDRLGVIAVQLEVNFVGTEQPHEHSFHNTDRFLRGAGFDLFRLDVRNCSTRALPARYVWPTRAETVSGLRQCYRAWD